MDDRILSDAVATDLNHMLDEIAETLEQIPSDDKDWKSKAISKIMDKAAGYVDADNGMRPWDFSAVKASDELIADDIIRIRPMRESDLDYYTSIRRQWSVLIRRMLEARQVGKPFFLQDIQADSSLFCVVETVADSVPIGYVAIKDTRLPLWEIAVEFDAKFCSKGLGSRAVLLFLQAVKALTNRGEYQSRVEADNIACQKAMGKIGARLVGICGSGVLKAEADRKSFEDEHLDQIDDHMRSLAAELNIEPRLLLSHVLDYRITV